MIIWSCGFTVHEPLELVDVIRRRGGVFHEAVSRFDCSGSVRGWNRLRSGMVYDTLNKTAPGEEE